jgi:hypothetical protein
MHLDSEIICSGMYVVRCVGASNRAFLPLCSGVLIAWVHKAPLPFLASSELSAKATSATVPIIMVGFVGGLARHDNSVHSLVRRPPICARAALSVCALNYLRIAAASRLVRRF